MIFKKIVETYERAGFPDEWKRHHQGGVIGYLPRERLATPSETHYAISSCEAMAWNPTVEGTKSEDTILVGSGPIEVLTRSGNWPEITVHLSGQAFPRPAILRK